MNGPVVFAKQLATYIKCPDRIERLTIRDFGKSPSRRDIQDMIRKAHKPLPARAVRDSNAYDGDHFVVQPVGALKPVRHRPPRIVSNGPMPAMPAKNALVTTTDIVRAIAKRFKIEPEDIFGIRRMQPIMEARHTAAYVLVNRGSSRSHTARIMRRSDHSTIINSLRHFEAEATDEMRAIAAEFIALGRK